MPALLKFLVPLAIFLSASNANAFTSLSSAAGNQVWVNHLTRLQQPMSDPMNEPSHEPIREPTKRLGQDALLPGNLSSKRVLFRVSMMDDEIQSCKTHSEYTKSYQVAIPVSFVSFHSKSFGLAYCWVHSHWKTTADLFNAQHSIQFARIKRSFISARVLISTFDGSTSSSRMACWVRTLTVKVPLLHQTNQTKQRLEQDALLPLVSSIHQCIGTCNAFRMIAYLDFNHVHKTASKQTRISEISNVNSYTTKNIDMKIQTMIMQRLCQLLSPRCTTG